RMVRMQHVETAAVTIVAIAKKRKVSPAKTRDLEIPNRRAFQTIGECSAGIRLERHRVRTHFNRRGLVLVVQFDGAVKPAVAHRAAWIIETHKGGKRHFRIRRYPATR